MYSDYLLIGEVLRPQGVAGQVKVRPDTDDPARFALLDTVYIKNGNEYAPLPISDIAVRGDFVYCVLGDASNRDMAEKQRGLLLYVDRAHAVTLPEDAYFISDLIDCRVTDRQGGVIGVLTDVLQPGANDVYVIKTPGGQTMYLPALKRVLLRVSPREGEIVIDESLLGEVAVLAD